MNVNKTSSVSKNVNWNIFKIACDLSHFYGNAVLEKAFVGAMKK